MRPEGQPDFLISLSMCVFCGLVWARGQGSVPGRSLVHLHGPAGPSEKCRPGITTPSGHPAPYHPPTMVSHCIYNKTQLLSEPHALGDLDPAVPMLCSALLSPTVPFLLSVLRAMAAAQWGLSWGPALSRRPPSRPPIRQARHQPGVPANHLPLPGITPTVSTFAI